MKILFLDAYFEPEITAYTHLEKDILEGLLQKGHSIEIVCPTPSRGVDNETKKRYRKIRNEWQSDRKVHIIRFFASDEKKNIISRVIRYLRSSFKTYQIAVKCEEMDIVFSNSTPPTQGLLSALVCKKLKARQKGFVSFIYNLQDIFPDSLVTTGLARKDSLLYRIGSKIEKKTYQYADKIIVISNSMRKNILDKGVPESKIKVIPNWIDTSKVVPVAKEANALFEEFAIPKEKFIVLYAGNLGAAQGTEVLIEAAERLKEHSEIQFVIFGNGIDFETIQRKIHEEHLNNVFLHALLPQNRVSEVYSLGDVDIITCKKGTGMSSMPSKLWSIMACNTEIIASFDEESDLAEVLRESQGGICVEPQNAAALAEAILSSYQRRKEGKPPQICSREYVEQHASKERCVSEYIALFEECVYSR